jgi:hypothetical protein
LSAITRKKIREMMSTLAASCFMMRKREREKKLIKSIRVVVGHIELNKCIQ